MRVCEQLNRSLKQAKSSYLEFEDACNAATMTCEEAARICGCKANEAQRKQRKTVIGGGATALGIGLVVAGLCAFFTGGLGAIAIVAGASAAGVGAVTCWYCYASCYAESEASFRNVKQKVNYLFSIAQDFQLNMTGVHTNLETISTQVNNTTHWAQNCNGSSLLLVHDALEHLDAKCSESQDTALDCRKRMNHIILELKQMRANTDTVQ